MSHNRRHAHPLSAGRDNDAAWAEIPDEHSDAEEAEEQPPPHETSDDEEEPDQGEGWVESITGLKEGDGATELLINGAKTAAASKVPVTDPPMHPTAVALEPMIGAEGWLKCCAAGQLARGRGYRAGMNVQREGPLRVRWLLWHAAP